MKITLFDRVSFPVESQRVIDENGFLRVPGRVARTGIQQYTAREMGLTDRPSNSLVNIYRPPEAVFNPESLASYDNADITVDHPDDLVDATTFKAVSVGHAISGGRVEGDFVVVDLLIKAQDAIDTIEDGKAELSAGYTAEYKPKNGISPDGTPYEFIQTDITINHIALCDRARAGRLARLFDSKPMGARTMTYKVTLDSGVSVEVADEATQTLIRTQFDSLRKRIKDAEEEVEKTKAEMDETEKENETLKAQSDTKDTEIASLKEKLSADSIASRLAEISAVRDSALVVAGKAFTCDSVEPVTIKRAALDAAGVKCRRYGTWDKAPDAYVESFFDAEEERKEAEDEDENENRQNANDAIKRLGGELGGKIKLGDAETQRASVRDTFLDKRYNRGGK